jgi:ADP-heptose:LPS heptosyltransferase
VTAPRCIIVRFSAIGDCVMAAHAASCVRRSQPEAFIAWVVEPRCAPVLDEARLVNQVAPFERDRWKKGVWSPLRWREQLRFYAGLRELRFDFGLDLQGHSKTAFCLRLSCSGRRLASIARDPLARVLNPLIEEPPPGTHMVERHLLTLRSLGDFPADSNPILPPLLEERAIVRSNVDPCRPLVSIAVGAGHASKAYPPESWSQIARSLTGEGFQVVFLGGPSDAAPPGAPGRDLVGKASLKQTMAWVAESSLHLAADTGTGHMAAALGTPVVSVFGPTDPRLFRPYTDLGVVLKKGSAPSMVKPDEVLDAALRLLTSTHEAISA